MKEDRGKHVRVATEPGNAVVEFIGIVLVLILPALILLGALATLTTAQFAANAAARDSARAFVRAESSELAPQAGKDAAKRVLGGRKLSASMDIEFSCESQPCLSPGARVESNVTIHATMPIIGTTVSVHDTARMTVDEYRRAR